MTPLNISEYSLYTENQVLPVLTKYLAQAASEVRERNNFFKLYGSTNFDWNPYCCIEKGVKGMTIFTAHEIIQHYRQVQFWMAVGIAFCLAQYIVSGCFLNFPIYISYCKARIGQRKREQMKLKLVMMQEPEASQRLDELSRPSVSEQGLHNMLMSGKIQCLEFTKATFNLIINLGFLCWILWVTNLENFEEEMTNTIARQIDLQPCHSCSPHQVKIINEMYRTY